MNPPFACASALSSAAVLGRAASASASAAACACASLASSSSVLSSIAPLQIFSASCCSTGVSLSNATIVSTEPRSPSFVTNACSYAADEVPGGSFSRTRFITASETIVSKLRPLSHASSVQPGMAGAVALA